MSKPSRRLARRTRTEGWPMGRRPLTRAYVVGWCTDDAPSLREARRATDELLRFALGQEAVEDDAVRTYWHEIGGHRAHLFLAARARETSDPLLQRYYHELRGKLRERPGSVLVVASTTARTPEAAKAAPSRALREGMRQAEASA